MFALWCMPVHQNAMKNVLTTSLICNESVLTTSLIGTLLTKLEIKIKMLYSVWR